MSAINEMWNALTGYEAIFDRVTLADTAIRNAIARHPEQAELLNGSFMTCHCDGFMPTVLYAAHCEHLLERIASGGDYRASTDSELLLQMRGAFAEKLDEYGQALSAYLFLRTYAGEMSVEWRETLEHMVKKNGYLNGNRRTADELEHKLLFQQRRDKPRRKPEEEDGQ